MHESLKEYFKYVESGHLRAVYCDDLVLFNYTDLTTFDRLWNPITMAARGIVFHKESGEVIARPFPKFFNLGEVIEPLPGGDYTIHEKMDGSLGIIYHYKGLWRVNTRGSFSSEQAIEGSCMLRQYDLDNIPTDLTLLAEIIYPANKIIVNYGDKRELVLLGAVLTSSGKDVSLSINEISKMTGIPVAPVHKMTINQAIKMRKILPKDKEGFVVRFNNGYRMKIKGEEYLKIAKILAHLSPLSLWECMKDGKVEETYLSQVPEEFRHEWEPIRDQLEANYLKIKEEIDQDISKLTGAFGNELTPEARKQIGLATQNNTSLNHPRAVFPALICGNTDKYIMNLIRPSSNKL